MLLITFISVVVLVIVGVSVPLLWRSIAGNELEHEMRGSLDVTDLRPRQLRASDDTSGRAAA